MLNAMRGRPQNPPCQCTYDVKLECGNIKDTIIKKTFKPKPTMLSRCDDSLMKSNATSFFIKELYDKCLGNINIKKLIPVKPPENASCDVRF